MKTAGRESPSSSAKSGPEQFTVSTTPSARPNGPRSVSAGSWRSSSALFFPIRTYRASSCGSSPTSGWTRNGPWPAPAPITTRAWWTNTAAPSWRTRSSKRCSTNKQHTKHQRLHPGGCSRLLILYFFVSLSYYSHPPRGWERGPGQPGLPAPAPWRSAGRSALRSGRSAWRFPLGFPWR